MDKICGDCRYFRVTDERDDADDVGKCRLEKVIGVFRGSMRACGSFSRYGEANPPVAAGGARTRPRRRVEPPQRLMTVSAGALAEALADLDGPQLKLAFTGALNEALMLREEDLGRQWDNGNLVLTPADEELKPKVLPIDQFFHKLVMVRDNLRVLEQKVNSHANLHDPERLDLHRRLSLCHTALVSLATGWVVPAAGEGAEGVARGLLRRLLREVEWSALALTAPALAERWVGGSARYDQEERPVEEPLETFFHRLVVLRDRLLALESQVAAHPHIAADEASSMGSYIRRCYGTLTTFNVLFRDREDYFTSAR